MLLPYSNYSEYIKDMLYLPLCLQGVSDRDLYFFPRNSNAVSPPSRMSQMWPCILCRSKIPVASPLFGCMELLSIDPERYSNLYLEFGEFFPS